MHIIIYLFTVIILCFKIVSPPLFLRRVFSISFQQYIHGSVRQVYNNIIYIYRGTSGILCTARVRIITLISHGDPMPSRKRSASDGRQTPTTSSCPGEGRQGPPIVCDGVFKCYVIILLWRYKSCSVEFRDNRIMCVILSSAPTCHQTSTLFEYLGTYLIRPYINP